jgi:TonB family protein
MVVDEQGNPTNIKVARSSGNPELDRKAKEAAEKYRFKPGLDKSGKPVKVSVTLQVNFKTNPDLKKDPSPNSAVKAPPQ